MKILGNVSVLPVLPPSLTRLSELAFNLWWSWEPAAQQLYAAIDPTLWEATSHNPVKLLRRVDQAKLDAAAANPDYLRAYHSVMAAFDSYMDPAGATWFKTNHAHRADRILAYFSAEFGLHEALPIYSGGLGVLSGDHCKAASDLGLPFIGVGFLYPQGYFTQRIDAQGQQQAEYEKIDFSEVPAQPAVDRNGGPILVQVDLPGRTVYAKIWRIQVGRVPVFLMDTDVERNAPQDRELSARLYGGDHEMRISQEVVLGIGGVRAVRALGYRPAVWHMNEGHSAFLGLERVREKVQRDGLTFDEAVEAVRSNSIFTTHTPVPAGNDAFAFELVEKFFWNYWTQLGLDRDRFIEFARQELPWGPQFSMTVLALRLSAYHNGVSELHGQVSRSMWQFLWPDLPVEQVPIGHITNGVHTQTWLAPELRALYSRYLPRDWSERSEEPAAWQAIDTIPDQELWGAHFVRKQQMVDFVRARVRTQYLRHGEGPGRVASALHLLDPKALTLGFARRFATYKRATLVFRDEGRLKRILNDAERPVQIVFSGKAHPADEPGKALIRQVYEYSQQPDYAGKIVFVEDYDMNVARHLIAGVDVWLNNPRRPHEASGTSGQKAALSGVLNFSVLDGWWVEGFDGVNGWAIGEDRAYKDQETQDAADAESLYQVLEGEIIPLFYQRDAQDTPATWVQRMKHAIRTCAPQFGMRRMVIDYANAYYLPAGEAGRRIQADSYTAARSLAAWKSRVRQRWPGVRLEASPRGDQQLTVGGALQLAAQVWLPDLDPAEVMVEALTGVLDAEGKLQQLAVTPLQYTGQEAGSHRYRGTLTPRHSGQFVLAVRVRPTHAELIHPYELGLSTWA